MPWPKKIDRSCENVMNGATLQVEGSGIGNETQKYPIKNLCISKSGRPIESHSYHDFANVPKSAADHAYLVRNFYNKNSIRDKMPFPLKLHKMLNEVYKFEMEDTVFWQQHGRCFKVNQPSKMKPILDLFFGGSKYSSFQRNLNMYGFKRITRGPDAGSYYHELFLKNYEHLCGRMKRTAVKGTQTRLASNPSDEPNFSSMPPLRNIIPNNAYETMFLSTGPILPEMISQVMPISTRAINVFPLNSSQSDMRVSNFASNVGQNFLQNKGAVNCMEKD